MKNLLIWDIDGTLIQGRGIGRRAMDKAFLSLYGIEEGFKDISMAGRLDAVILNDAFNAHSITGRNTKKYFDIYCSYLKEEIDKLTSPIFAPGILLLLEELNKRDDTLCVLGTGNIENAARIKLAFHDMNKYFPTGGFGNTEAERWEIIDEARINASKLCNTVFKPENTYVIGDTPKDIECGKILNIKTVGVATGPYSPEQLQESGADYVFKDFTRYENFIDILG